MCSHPDGLREFSLGVPRFPRLNDKKYIKNFTTFETFFRFALPELYSNQAQEFHPKRDHSPKIPIEMHLIFLGHESRLIPKFRARRKMGILELGVSNSDYAPRNPRLFCQCIHRMIRFLLNQSLPS